MKLKPFEAGRYDDNSIVIRNPATGKQELFSEEQFEIVKFLKQNENESLLALLLPNIGIAKKDHINSCLKVLSKLKRMQVVDNYAITGRPSSSDTATLELEQSGSTKIKFSAGETFFAVCFALGERLFSWLGAHGILLLCIAAAAFSFLFFPFEGLDNAFQSGELNYPAVFAGLYLTAAAALSMRGILQGAFLRSQGRQSARHRLRLYFPLVALDCDKREVNLLGHGARIRMGLIGLLTPLAFSAVFTGLYVGGLITLPSAFFGFAACIWAALTLACPFFPGDVADILHVLFLRDELKERIASNLRNIFRTKGRLSREMLFGLVITFAWLLAWLDCLRSFWDVVANLVGVDFFFPAFSERRMGALALVSCLIFLLAMPAFVFLWGLARDKLFSRRKIIVEKGKVKDSLSFEERMAALEKIPLFAYLNDQERLSLLNEMQPAFFSHGEYLMHQGEVGNEFYVLVKGRANAYFSDMQGRIYHLADLAEGDAFGEIALIDDVPRTASIISDDGCIVLVLNKAGFDNFARSLGSPDRVKTMIRLTSFFRRHPLFSKLTARDQAQLIDTFRFESITIGEEVPKSNENFYVIYSGKVRVDTPEDGDDVILQSDDCFGYADGIMARYIAQEGTGLLTVRRNEFHTLIWQKLVERPDLFI